MRHEAGGGLVEQQYLRAHSKSPCNFHQSAMAVSELASGSILKPLQADKLNQLARVGSVARCLRTTAFAADQGAQDTDPRMTRKTDHHVVDHRQVTEKLDGLKCSGDATKRGVGQRSQVKQLPVHRHL